MDCNVLFWLGERCAKQELVESLLQIFDALSADKLTLHQGYHLPGDSEENTGLRARAELQLIGEHYEFNELWEKYLHPKLTQIANPLFRQVVNRLEKLHFNLSSWQQAGREWDSISYGRSAIEPHEQDKYPGSVDVLIDAARDCLEWLMRNQTSNAIEWCDQFVDSEVPLLRRLAIYAYFSFSDLTADNKMDWLLGHIGLHDNMAHHEIFEGVGDAYPETTQGIRERIIAEIHSFSWPDESEDQFERFTARQHFDWLSWLNSKDPQCLLVKQALDDVLGRYPEFVENEHPDLTHWTGGGVVVPQSPWSVEELLSKPAGEWLPELLSFQGDDWRGPDRNGLIQFVQEAAKQQLTWGIALADALKENGNWESDLWRSLLCAWKDIDVDENDYRKILGWLEREELQRKHSRKIADILYEMVKSGGKEYAPIMLQQANEIAGQLLASIDRDESQEADDWLREAINQPAGILAEFWLESLSIWRKQQDPVPSSMNEGYRQALLGIINDHTSVGLLGKSVLASQFSFLLTVDEEWTKTNLLPLFSEDQIRDEFHAVWDGFLTLGQLNPSVATLLEDPLFQAVRSFEGSLFQRQQDSFVKYYTAMVIYYIADPLERWIPELLNRGDEKIHRAFASNITIHLRDMDEARQQELWGRWLKTYWENRVLGVPAVLQPGEIKRMLEWLPHLSAVFPEVVNAAIRMPSCALQHCSIIHNIAHSTLPSVYPVEVAKLLLYMEAQLEMPSYIWHGAKEIITILLKNGLPADIEQRLIELVASRGLQ
jgi:hypothetical protein